MAKRRPGSKALIKDINKILVLSTIREHGPISRTDVAKITGLNLSTISKICEELYSQNMLFDIGTGTSSGGRRPIQMLFNNSLGYIISIKIEENHIRFAVTNLKPSIIDYYEYECPSDYEKIIDIIKEKSSDITQKMREKEQKLMGVGIAISGIVNQPKGELFKSSFLNWSGKTLARDLSESIKVPIHIDNDVNCYTLAQHWLGSGKGHKNIICLTIGEGIGGGMIVRDRLFRGQHGGAGEIGHMIIRADGRECYCGQKGCLEMYASFPGIISAMNEKSGGDYSMEEIRKLAEEEDTCALSILEKAGSALGTALINLTMCYDPELIIIGGEGIEDLKSYLPAAKRQYSDNWFSRSGMEKVPILSDEPGNRFFMLGASLLVIDHLFGAPLYETENPLL